MSLIGRIHGRFVYSRRLRVLSERIAALLPQGARVLDVGCGDGLLAKMIVERRPDVQLRGIDVLVRGHTHIPVEPFDGLQLPCADKSVDVVMMVDVLHHTADPMVLLREASRVARTAVVLKDHARDGVFDEATLRLMDHVGNARHGVALPYNYWPRGRWIDAFARLGMKIEAWQTRLGLYPAPASWLFDRSLHFIARLRTA